MTEYAPEYSKRERWIIVLKIIAIIVPLYLVMEYWFKDWITDYSTKANCYQYGPLNGIELIFYGVFVFIPLSFIGVIFLFEGKRSIRIFKIGQNPLPGEKVLRRTKYKYGWKAMLQPAALMLIVLLLLVMSIWGGFQAHKLSLKIQPCEAPEIIW